MWAAKALQNMHTLFFPWEKRSPPFQALRKERLWSPWALPQIAQRVLHREQTYKASHTWHWHIKCYDLCVVISFFPFHPYNQPQEPEAQKSSHLLRGPVLIERQNSNPNVFATQIQASQPRMIPPSKLKVTTKLKWTPIIYMCVYVRIHTYTWYVSL